MNDARSTALGRLAGSAPGSRRLHRWLQCACLVLLLGACGGEDAGDPAPAATGADTTAAPTADARLSAADARDIAREAYVYGFPMVMHYKTLYNYTIDTASPEYKGPFNRANCEARLFTPADRAVVTPNADTPYCMFWLDLRAEPVVLHVPEMEPSRFYHFQLIDFYTHNFAYVGTLTTGNDAGVFLIAGPGWQGPVPDSVDAVLRSETSYVFNVTRTQLFGADDLERVAAIQADYRIEPLSEFLGNAAPPPPPAPAFPEWEEGAQFDERFYAYLDLVLDLLGAPAPGREALWGRLARLGIGPGLDFDAGTFTEDVAAAIAEGRKAGFDEIEAFIAANAGDPLLSGKIFGTREFLAERATSDFGLAQLDLLRAAAAHAGLYGNSAAEAVYPTYFTDSEGRPLDASSSDYRLTFPAGELPPVRAFWSLSLYDGRTQLFVDNPLDRYLLNSAMLDELVFEDDGSLTLHIRNASPGDARLPNWLPAPNGPFYLVMRLYGPAPEVLDGSWKPPPVVRSPGAD